MIAQPANTRAARAARATGAWPQAWLLSFTVGAQLSVCFLQMLPQAMAADPQAGRLFACMLLGLVIAFVAHKLVLARVPRSHFKLLGGCGTVLALLACMTAPVIMTQLPGSPYPSIFLCSGFVYFALAGAVPRLHADAGRKQVSLQCAGLFAGLLLGMLPG